MNFTYGKDAEFERLMQGKPNFDKRDERWFVLQEEMKPKRVQQKKTDSTKKRAYRDER